VELIADSLMAPVLTLQTFRGILLTQIMARHQDNQDIFNSVTKAIIEMVMTHVQNAL